METRTIFTADEALREGLVDRVQELGETSISSAEIDAAVELAR